MITELDIRWNCFLASEGLWRQQFNQVQWDILLSCLQRSDYAKARAMVADWRGKQLYITKWVPGDHYYVFGEKFNRYDQAVARAGELGYSVRGVQERFVYVREGD